MTEKKWIETDLLRVFLIVSEVRYLKDAAQRLNQTPSAVSQSIKVLEEHLNVKLFERDSRPLTHTAAGRRLYSRGQELMLLSESLFDEIQDEGKNLTNLRLGLSESAAGSYGPWLIAELKEKTQELEVQSGLTYPMSKALQAGKIDILISPEGLFENNFFERIDLLEEDFLVIVKKGTRPFTSLYEFQQFAFMHPLIEYNKQSSDRIQVDRILRSIGMRAKIQTAVSTSYLLVGLVAELNGWSIVTPTNLWTSGHFIQGVDFFTIPGRRMRRQSWIIGKCGVSNRMKTVVHAAARNAMKKYLLPKMDSVVPGLSSHMHLLSH